VNVNKKGFKHDCFNVWSASFSLFLGQVGFGQIKKIALKIVATLETVENYSSDRNFRTGSV
jgi:hypothetical protein